MKRDWLAAQLRLRADGGRRRRRAVARRLRRDHRRRRELQGRPEERRPVLAQDAAGKTFKQPGNLYNLIETSLCGEEPKFTAKGVKPDLDGDGKVGEFGEALPDADFLVAAARDFDRRRQSCGASAKAYKPNATDALTALVVMTPTMSEYFGAGRTRAS